MSTKLNQSNTSKRTSSVPLDDLYNLVQQLVPSVEREANGFSFRGRFGTTHLQVRPVGHVSRDGARVSDVVSTTTDLTILPSDGETSEEALVALNRYAAMSAVAVVQRGQRTVIANRLSAFEGDHEAWNLYTPMLAFAAVSQSDTAIQTMLRADGAGAQDECEGLPEADTASPWGAEDFEAVQARLDQIGILANSDASGLTAEFPWDTGAASHMERFLGGPLRRTSLLRITTDEQHPALGNGLLCRLALPISYPRENLAAAACRLNILELVAIDAPPFLGAWTVDQGTSSLTFVSFWPDLLYHPGVAANLTTWMMARSRIAKRWTEVDIGLRELAKGMRTSKGTTDARLERSAE